MNRLMLKTVLVMTALVLPMVLAGCLPPPKETIVMPASGATYIGTADAPPPVQHHDELPAEIVISYASQPASLNVYLNSAPIGQHFTLGATEARASFSVVAEFLRQGKNDLRVNPQSGGPVSTFIFDNAGPKVIIEKVTCSDGDCQTINGGSVAVTVAVIDPSETTSLFLQANDYQWEGGVDNSQYVPFKTGAVVQGTSYAMTNAGANKYQVTVPESKLYTFVAADENGYTATTDYLAEGQKINSVFKMRIGKTLLDSMVPVIEPMVDQMHQYSKVAMDDYGKAYPAEAGAMESPVLDSMNEWWTSGAIFYGRTDMGASTANMSDCGYVDLDAELTQTNFTCSSIKTDKKTGARYCLQDRVDLNGSRPDAKEGRCTRIVVWRLKLDDMENMSFTLSDAVNGRLVLDMDLLDGSDAGNIALNADMGIRHIKCGTRYPTQSFCTTTLFGACIGNEQGVPVTAAGTPTSTMTHAPKYYCRDDGGASAALGIVALGDLKVTATSGNPSGFLDAIVQNGNLLLNIDSANFRLNLSGLTIGSWLDGFISFLSGLLDSIFVDIMASVIEQNMTDFKLGFDIDTEAGGSMRMQSQAYQVFTNADNNAATPVEWYMFYSGFLRPLDPHPDVEPLLGSYFVRDELLLPADNTASAIDNFSIGINANIINQGLASLYRSGIMHFTVASFKKDGGPKVYFGPDATALEPGIVKGDLRMVLMPNSPATFEMQQGSAGSQATLEYRGAAMDIQIFQNAAWHTLFHAQVDIRAGVLLSVVDQKVHMTIQGTPQIDIRELLDFNVSVEGSNSQFNLFIGRAAVETMVNQLLGFAIPQVADSFLVIDVPDIPGPLGTRVITTTEGIEANNGAHLGFSMGLNLQTGQ